MLNILDVKTALAEQIRRYIDQEHLELECRGDSGAPLNLNSCVLLAGIGNQGAKMVSQIMRQLVTIGVSSDNYTGLALIDANCPGRDDQIEYIVMEDCHIPRSRVQEKLLERTDYISGTLEVLNTRLMNVMGKTSANLKIYVVSDLAENLFAGCPMLLCLLEDKLNSFFAANTGIEFTGLFFQSAMLKTKQEQAGVFAAWQEINYMSSPNFKFEIGLGSLPGQRANRLIRDKPILAISYLYSDFNENFSPILKTVEGEFSKAEMLAVLVYLKSSSQFNEARIFNSLQMPAPTLPNGLPRYAAIGYSKKSIKITPIFCYTCWYLLQEIYSSNKGKAGYISQDWESVLSELEIDNVGIEALGSEVYSPVKETLKDIEEIHLRLEKNVVKELSAETLDTAEKLLMGDKAELIFEERIIKSARQITEGYLPKQLEGFRRILRGYLQNERRGLFFVKCLLRSDEGNNKQSLIKHLELKINELMVRSDALRQRADRASQQALSRLEIEPDKKGLLGLGNKKNNFLQRLIEVKYELLQKAVVYDQLREILRAYLSCASDLYAIVLRQEENILSLKKALSDICNAEQKRLVAAGEDGLIGLVKDRFNENQKDEISNVALARIFRDNDPSIFREDGKLLKEVVKSLLNNTRKLLGQTHIQTLSLEQLLETLTQTQPAKGKQVVEDLYAKCNLALGLSKGVMSRQPETHYYFFNNVGNSSLRNYIKELFQSKANDVSFVDYKSIKSIRMVKACFGFSITDIYFYRNYEKAYQLFYADLNGQDEHV
ncbi:hypothetical protein [Desulfosporosinus youngiae]|uniref:Uncharacterized protein n=1 Tax=Desulfosporosinus youngiae DSM 17734 TaxID=768710 RepID=H5Y5X3_9FIRM|nr:hypothetical protein [Desulfosporosinus youngiae]EHQ90912.1 hypothetical protein DesyoDRAFT_3939 [Desulfosporosinus youngiae DSM 17734]